LSCVRTNSRSVPCSVWRRRLGSTYLSVVLTMAKHRVIIHRAYYRKSTHDIDGNDEIVVVAQGTREFTDRELDQLARQNGLEGLHVDEITEAD